jgi:2-polyprenyl-3-methyl-5-hydroxy-6-metoxy-1,4-benzoquinol methylase
MSLTQSKKHWEDMGHLDPYWAILSEPGTKFGRWNLEQFLETGQSEISSLVNSAKELGLPKEYVSALDFGCGVGRLTQALASHFHSVVGIDISEAMIHRAVTLNPPENCEFLLNRSESLPFFTDQFDLVYTVLVLQHVPARESIKRYVAEFVRVLKPQGLLVMQIPNYVPLRRRLQARSRLYAWLRSAGFSEKLLYDGLGLHPIPMNFLPEKDVVAIVESGGGTTLRVQADHRAGPHISSRVYYASKNA